MKAPMTLSRDTKIIAMGVLLCVCGSGPFYVMPNYLQSAVHDFGLSSSQIGLLSGAEGLGIASACVATGLLARRLNWIAVLVCAAVCALGNALIVYAHGFGPILAVRTVCGLAGEGPLYAMSYMLLGSAGNPDRAFGVAITALAVFSAVALHFERALYGALGAGGILVPFAALAVVVVGLIIRSRSLDLRPQGAAPDLRRGPRWDAVVILLSIGVWSCGPGAFWPFSEAAAVVMGVSAPVIAQALSASLLVGLLGAALPAVIGDRFGRLVPVTLATAIAGMSVVMFFAHRDLFSLTAALSLLQFSWNLAVVYQLAGLAVVDPHGRYSALGAVSQFGGIAVGPVVAGWVTQGAGYPSLVVIVAGFVAVGWGLFVAGQRLGRSGAAVTVERKTA